MTGHKTDMNITKIEKYKKTMKSIFMTEHKSDINITKIQKTEQYFFDGAQNKHENY